MHAPLPHIGAPAAVRDAVVVDLFCGAGSLSAGIEDALLELGWRPRMNAVNHWNVATSTYALNHAGANVHCVSLDAAFPAHVVPGLHVDLLAAGIECTYFSRARGGKPVNDQQRMSPWHVVRWCTELNVDRVLLENVPEIVKWGPVSPRTGKPIKAREGEYYEAFHNAMAHIGLPLDARVICCAEHGDPTTRTRWFGMARRGRKSVTWPAPSYARDGAGGLPRYRAARECIDWSIRGRSIFDRPRPLAPKTLMRIWAGILKFGWPEPFIVVLKQHADARGIDLPLPTVHAGGQHFGLVQPFVLNRHGDNGGHCRGSSIDEPAPTLTISGGGYVVEPFFFPANQGLERNRGHRSVDDPLCTVTASGTDLALVEPFVLSQASGGAPRSTDAPVQTIPIGGAHALVAPYYSSGSGEGCGSVNDPLRHPLPHVRAARARGRHVDLDAGAALPLHRQQDTPAHAIDGALGGLAGAHKIVKVSGRFYAWADLDRRTAPKSGAA